MSLTILHLEDDISLQLPIKEVLHLLEPDAKILQFINGEDALEFILQARDTINLYILDIRLPGRLDGIDVAKAVRERDLEGHIVMMSAFIRPPTLTLQQLRAQWMQKPWEMTELHAALKVASQHLAKHSNQA